jgi:hypothetical protein
MPDLFTIGKGHRSASPVSSAAPSLGVRQSHLNGCLGSCRPDQ